MSQPRTVLVTGAAQGIGACIARGFARADWRVVATDHNPKKLAESLEGIRAIRRDAESIELDVRDPEAIERAFAPIGSLDALINNAGIGRWQDPLELSVADWDNVLNTNLRGAFLCARAAAARMADGGAIVNIASTRALMSEPHGEAYAASKGGILALTHALAASLSNRRIRVNAISPGWIQNDDYGELREIDHVQHPAGRVGKPEDIARACLFLTDPANDFITGANFVIDGGMVRKMIYEE